MVGDDMKKGFTLAELLGVIAVLGIIALITVPAINRSLDSGREDLYETQIKKKKKGGEDYYLEHLSELPTATGDIKCDLTIEVLQKNGYLPMDIKNPKTNDNFSQLTSVCVEMVGPNEYRYSVKEAN